MNPKILFLAKKAWKDADAILVGAGAGMGVDSGLPDFRGKSGFWKAYPPLAKMGIEFEEMANPYWFTKNPSLAWGFYGHRLNLYQKTKPHCGFNILLNKFKEENSLLSQAWVMEPKKKVQDIVKELSITGLKIKEFYRIKIGE